MISMLCVTDFALRDSLKSKSKNRESREPIDMIKFSKVPFPSTKHPWTVVFWSCIWCTEQFKWLFFLYDLLFFLQTPLTESLIEFTDTAMNRVAADLFLCKFSPSLISPLITSSHYISLITSGLRFTLCQNDMFLYQILNTQVLDYSTKSDI